MRWRVIVGLLSVSGLVVVYLFQNIDVAGALGAQGSSISRFIINRTLRFLLNDLFAIGIIYALFVQRKYIVFALWVQLAGVVFFLIPYFVLKLNFPSYNGPMINYLHRLILNPTLLLLLIPGFWYQRQQASA